MVFLSLILLSVFKVFTPRVTSFFITRNIVRAISMRFFFPVLALILVVSFLGWGLNPILSVEFLGAAILGLTLRNTVIRVFTIVSMVRRGEPFLMAVALHLIHLISSTIKPLRLIIRIFINLFLGHLVLRLLVLPGLLPLIGLVFIIRYELLVLTIQGVVLITLLFPCF